MATALLCCIFSVFAIAFASIPRFVEVADLERYGNMAALCAGMALIFLCLWAIVYPSDGDGGLPV